MFEILVELVFERVARTAGARALGAAALDHEISDDPVKRQAWLNFVIVGYLGEGVASCTKTDPQAKGLGEYVRALHTDIPDKLVP